MSGWDDSPVVLRGGQKRVATVTKSESAVNAAKRAGIAVSTSSKGPVGQHKGPADYQQKAKLDRENEVKPPPKVDMSVAKTIAAARAAIKLPDGKAMTQKDLATKINEPQKTIVDYEQGKAIPNQATLGKIERALGVKLRGDPKLIGTPLPKPGEKKK